MEPNQPLLRSSYPTRTQKVGGLNCLFLKCYKRGMVPIANFGPDKTSGKGFFTFGMCTFVILMVIITFLPEKAKDLYIK